MPTDIASLFIKVDSKGVVTASRDLNKLTDDSKRTEKATDGVTSSFGSLKVAVVALATSYAALKMAKYVKDATLLAARYETLGVVMRVVGNNAGFSGDQMEDFARGLQSAGIAMIESRNTLARMVQAQIDLTKSTELARIAQNAATIGGINSSEAFERMILGIQRGMPRILTTIGLNVSFNKSYKDLADSLDINVGALTELQRVQARTNAVVKSGVLIQGAYEASMETAGKQVLSLKRHLDNLKVLFGTVFTPALAEIIGVITGNIKGMNEELEKNKEAWADWGTGIRLVLISVQVELIKWDQELDRLGVGIAAIGLLTFAPLELFTRLTTGFQESRVEFGLFADLMISSLGSFEDYNKEIAALEKRHAELEFAMSKEGKALAKLEKERLESIRLEKVAKAKQTETVDLATKKQLKIQDAFSKAYNKSILTTQDFELASLKIKVDAFRAAKVNEIQLEEWMQNEIKNIKLRAQNEELELLEELAENDSAFAERAIEVMGEILDAEEKKWAKILRDDDAAHTLRIQKEEAYRDKILGTIEDIVVAQEEATQRLAPGAPTANISPGPSAASPSGGGDQFFIFRNQRFSSEADVQAYIRNLQSITDATRSAAESAARIAQAAADESSRILQRAADDAAREMQDIADQRVELEIQILEQTGHAAEAAGIRRLLELAAMDESLRPLQQRLFFLEDEAKANQEAADAAEEAAKATRDLARAQDAAVRTWRGSISTLVSQGRAIQDFINSLGAVGSSITLSAARAAFSADLASAQAGDPSAFNRITQSAGAFISTAATTVGSSVDLARIVAGVKSELSKLDPVIELDQNIELLKLIEKNTSTTATATERLDIVGIKAIFDLEQTLTLVDNSEGLPEHLKKMIVAQVGDYKLFLEAKLEEDTPEDIKRLLIDGTNTYLAIINAIAGTFDDDSTKLISAEGDFLATVNAAFGGADDKATKLAIKAAGDYEAKVFAIFESADPNSDKLAIKAGGDFVADVSAIFAGADPKSTILALDAARDYIATVNAEFGNADPESAKLAIAAKGDFITTVNAEFGEGDTTATKLAITASGEYTASVIALFESADPNSQKLAIDAGGKFIADVEAAFEKADPKSQILALDAAGIYVATVNAVFGEADKKSTILAITATGNYEAIVIAALGEGDEDAEKLALTTGNDFLTSVRHTIESDLSPDDKLITLATSSDLSRAVIQIIESDLSPDDKEIALATSSDVFRTVTQVIDSDLSPEDKSIALATSNDISRTVTHIIDSDLTQEDKNIALATSRNLRRNVVQIINSDLSSQDKDIALATNSNLSRIVGQIIDSDLTPEDKSIALLISDAISRDITATMTTTMSAAEQQLAIAEDHKATVDWAAEFADDPTTDQLRLLLKGLGTKTTVSVEGDMIWTPESALKELWKDILTATGQTAANTAKFVAAVPTGSTSSTYASTWEDPITKNTISGTATITVLHGTIYKSDGSTIDYAGGGIFTNGVVSQPTLFNNSQMGESGPEAIMPLVRSSEGLGVRVMGGDTSPEQTALLKRIVDAIETGNFQIAKNTGKSAKILTEFDFNGMPAERTIN